MSRIGQAESAGFDRIEAVAPKLDAKKVYGILPKDRAKPYDMREILKTIVDGS